MSLRRAAGAAVLVALAVMVPAGCGDDDDGGSSGSSDRDVALDAEAKAGARTAQTTVEVYATDNGGHYDGADVDTLRQIEPSLPDNIELLAQADTYEVTVTSDTGTDFTVERNSDGSITNSCDPPGAGGCPASGAW